MKSMVYWSALLSSTLIMTQCTNDQRITQKKDIPIERSLAYKDSFSASAYYEDLYNSAEMKYAFKGTTPEEVDRVKGLLMVMELGKEHLLFVHITEDAPLEIHQNLM